MATIGNLRTALNKLIRALRDHEIFSLPNDIQQAWTEMVLEASELSARLDDASASSPQYAEVIELLNVATAAIRSANSASSARAALAAARRALTRLRQVLGV